MAQIKRILIANRGEIAVRIIRGCKELGIETISIYSTADKESLHVALADYSICVGPGAVQDSYLNLERIMSAAVALAVDAIHPGYGFLSENSKFAQMCEECNIAFIGPASNSIKLMGNKSTAREIMAANNVPVIPGSDGIVETPEEANKIAEIIGFPVIVKASLGGGGKGMRIINSSDEMEKFIDQARAEASNAFGDASIYIEKYITTSKHIEFQILADKYGNVVHLNDRECSIQRNNQKVLEEAPASCLDDELRARMGHTAVEAAKAIGYINAGTIEFLVDENNNFYFMEMNTRIQVEHPITEMITGVDLIKQQIKIAEGEHLPFIQEDIKIHGHAIECRINAEDPDNNFTPCAGLIKELHLPGGKGVRIDSHIYQNYKIPLYYDSMICKLITWGDNREEAISKMNMALSEVIIEDIKTNVSLLQKIIEHPDFLVGNIDTKFLNKIIR
ncbi:acetyl-CoA carboxylase biotin carboxylase subunit [Alkalibaculum sp. M08DMB]|uniref:Biotin carboxylase n=1 Tax=Alkalibaculum sporogenes TaxID=2655001 RepID=A0A6A7KAR9_9FIRM|nr:acetyl-CoA carboxylase biotin carboxylase subunit [Alkalibaculum sporogenes]MPW26381.1 acetyl-CoA carboxylase biotin carboxylase subunit [Alkalibaculum sporogenes]